MKPKTYKIKELRTNKIYGSGLLTNMNELLKLILEENNYIINKIAQNANEWRIYVTKKSSL